MTEKNERERKAQAESFADQFISENQGLMKKIEKHDVSEKTLREEAMRDAKDLVTVNKDQPTELLCGLTNEATTRIARALLSEAERADRAEAEWKDVSMKYAESLAHAFALQEQRDDLRAALAVLKGAAETVSDGGMGDCASCATSGRIVENALSSEIVKRVTT